MSDVLSVIAPLAETKRIELESEVTPSLTRTIIWRIGTRFKQILYILLSNAVKFTPANGRVQVSARPDYGQIQFCVIDNGMGIPPEQHTAIFEEFTQVAPAASGVGGAGLGLTITKRIVELHGGRIWVETNWVREAASIYHPRRDRRRKRFEAVVLHYDRIDPMEKVLIADDNQASRDLVRAILKPVRCQHYGSVRRPAGA